MKRQFNASIIGEGDLFVAQCLEVDIASQGATPEEALHNLTEAIELHFEEPIATVTPVMHSLEANVRVS